MSFKSCAEACGLPGNNKEEENVRKRSAKYREVAKEHFLIELWLVETLKIVTNLTLRAAEGTHAFRVDLAANLYDRQPYMAHDGPVDTFDGDPIYIAEAARLCLLEDGEECADVAAINALVNLWTYGEDAEPAATAAQPTMYGLDVGSNRRGKGRPRKDPNEVKKPDLFGDRKVSKDRYNEIVRVAGAKLRELPKEQRSARAKEMVTELEVQYEGRVVSDRTLLNYADDPARSIHRQGGTYFSDEFEADIAAVVRHYRSWKLYVSKDMITAWAMGEVKRHGLKLTLPELSGGWYNGFLRRQDLLTGASRPLEITRDLWSTSENVKQYYEVLEKVLLDEGIAERNPAFDPLVPFSEKLLILHPERLMSYDETAVSLDETVGSKAAKTKTVRAGRGDEGRVAATRESTHITATGGRIGYKALPVMVVFGSGQRYQQRWCGEPPVGNVLRGVQQTIELADGSPNTSEVLALYHANDKGSMNSEMCVAYTDRIIIPSARVANPALANETGRRSLEICDGVQVHLAAERLRLLREAGVHACLRVPHTTHITQGEDTIIFGPFKDDYRVKKMELMGQCVFNRPAGKTQLGLEDFPVCFKEPWEKAFRREKLVQAWAKDGIIPYTRSCMWHLIADEEKKAVAAAALDAREKGAAALHALRGAPLSGRRVRQPVGDGVDDDDGDDDRDGVDEGWNQIAEAGVRGQTAAPAIRKAVDRFTPSQDQESLSQLSHGTLLAQTKRMRENQDDARHALTDEDNKRKLKRDGQMGAKPAGLYNKGPITSDASYALVKQATVYREAQEDAKGDRKRVKTKKSKEKAKTNREQTETAIDEISRGEAEFPGAYSLEQLKAIAAHLLPKLKLGTATREVVIRELGVPKQIGDAIEVARAMEAARSKATRRANAAVAGGQNDRAVPDAAPPAKRTTVKRGGRGRGKGASDAPRPDADTGAGAPGSGTGRGRGRGGGGFTPVRPSGPPGASGGPRGGGR